MASFMDLSRIEIQIPSEKSATDPTWTGVSNGDPHAESLALHIQQLLDKWMAHFDRRFEELRSSQSGWGSHDTGCFKDVLNLSGSSPVEHGIHHEQVVSKRAAFAEESEKTCVFDYEENMEIEGELLQEQRHTQSRTSKASNLDMSVALRGRLSMQQKLEELFESLASKKKKRLRLCGRIAHHSHFENFISFAIILNGIFIGVQVDIAARFGDADHFVFSMAELAFFIIFCVELLLRVCGLGIAEWIKSAWNMFDALLVLVQLVEFTVKVTGESAGHGGATGRILRVFRIVRIVRVVRLLRFFVQLRVMVKMIMFSLESLFWLMVLLLAMMYVVSIVFTQGVTNYGATDGADWERAKFLKEQFGNIPTSTLTLFKAITNGIAWGELCDPLFQMNVFFGSIFVFFVFFVFFSVLNVVTGVFVDGAIQHGGQERELLVAAERKSLEGMCMKLMELLVDIDTDNSGSITLDELVQCCKDPTFSSYFTALQIHTTDTVALFRYLDSNNDGEIDIQEFIDGCMRVRGGARNIDLHMLFSAFHNEIKKRMRKVESLLTNLQVDMFNMDNQLSSVKADICKIPAVFCGPREEPPRKPFAPKPLDSRLGKFVRGSL